MAAYKIHGTFFVNGTNASQGKELYKRIVSEGHAIGNHTYSHDYERIYTSIESYLQDHRKLETLIYEETGIRPKIIRFPGGSNNTVSHRYGGKDFMRKLIQRMEEEGYQYFDWNVTSKDASSACPSKDTIIEAVLKNVEEKENAIILFHDSAAKTSTVEALPIIIEALKKKGYSFSTLTEDSYYVHF
ncbi:peptidoglycan/xylan/chitin deacetylase (PgdA/CDA1 family) [Anaerosolibacter carboniphilus]|uniref:Peptidoglycan/xylan/chitin deacetylase (PgdA/CDA1 family) n=1 Tax=Anaerosolibacter carboniphilus TaxID=1417629 RepID=A0A841L0F1_9FIRM|nr:peptidoglycan/xylan/chitin deacetylase (PgdA/CDA1 family) [Anaerosolibacter carboniphilus]